jgi:hypothetical protein
MVKVKPESECKTNYEQSTTLVPARFTAGVNAATWQGEAIAGQSLYIAQMSNMEILSRREKGINRISDAQWRTDTVTKGAPIIGTRMKAASDKQITGFRPYRSALEATSLPPRVADQMQNLLNRAGAIVTAMVNTKKAQG